VRASRSSCRAVARCGGSGGYTLATVWGTLFDSGRGAVAKWWRPLVIAFGDEPGVRGVGESLASLSPGGARGEGSRREPLLSRRAEE
jgi:hypothetical protein